MKVSTFEPTPALQPYVEAYHVVEAGSESLHRVLPNTGLTMVFRFRGDVSFVEGEHVLSIAQHSVSGLRRSAKNVIYSKGAGTLIVRLKPGMGHIFFKEPIHELFEESVSLSDLSGYKDLCDFEDRFAAAEDNLSRKEVIESFLLSRIDRNISDQLVKAALKKIDDNLFTIRIGELSNELFISQDAFEKRFRKAVGASPKQMVSLLRMKTILNQPVDVMSLSQLALSAGYFDQAHFNKAFKQFTGQTPGEFRKSPSLWR